MWYAEVSAVIFEGSGWCVCVEVSAVFFERSAWRGEVSAVIFDVSAWSIALPRKTFSHEERKRMVRGGVRGYFRCKCMVRRGVRGYFRGRCICVGCQVGFYEGVRPWLKEVSAVIFEGSA